MSYQLRQMVLINAGTNKHVPSNRITSIDPRGGAAVIGANGVGKTSTLRILPLFFGHLPSQIVTSGHGQEPMIRFILPTESSAIAFEYQRGSGNDDDLRMAVIRRRRDDMDAAEYRFYRCGFRKDLFVDEGRFLTDEETLKRANALGIATTSKLSTSDYRCVILKTTSNSKDKERLRRFSLDFSFGPKHLDNLDRLVAAMVKDHISFVDIIQVAVGMVQHELGHGAERAKLSFKQGRAPIERWLSNRSACVDALNLAPKVDELGEALADHRVSEARFRELRADVRLTSFARNEELTSLSKEINDLNDARSLAMEKEGEDHLRITGLCSKANEAVVLTKQAFDGAAADETFFDTERAHFWESQIQELPTLRIQKKNLDDQVRLAIAENTEASSKYAEMIQSSQRESAQHILTLEVGKKPHQVRHDKSIFDIEAAQEQILKDAASVYTAKHDELNVSMEPLVEQRGHWASQENAPKASLQSEKNLADANARLLKHTQDISQVLHVATRAGGNVSDARHLYEKQERVLNAAKADVKLAAQSLAKAHELMNPTFGTLQSTLLAHDDESWKKNLAKIINPALLDRADLSPQAISDASDAAYGWQMDTGVLGLPDWTNNDLMRQAVEQAVSCHEAALAHLAKMEEALELASRKLNEFNQAESVAKARLSLLEGQTAGFDGSVSLATKAIETEKKEGKNKAASELSRIANAINDIKAQLRAQDLENTTSINKIKATHFELRAKADQLLKDAIADIDAKIKSFTDDTVERIKVIEMQLKDHLSASGVDVDQLNKIQQNVIETDRLITLREGKESLVKRWHDWLDAGGKTRVATLRSQAGAARDAAQLTSLQLTEFNKGVEQIQAEYVQISTAKAKRKDIIDDDLVILVDLEEEFGDYLPLHESQIDTKVAARDLRSRVQKERKDLSALTILISNLFNSLRLSLTSKNNLVKDLIDTSLQLVSSHTDIGKAAELCTSYKLIGPQVVTDVNASLRSLLVHISAFQSSIGSFENEVAAFNNKLQEGLSSVHCFDRIKDLKLHIVTNFDGLGFYKKLNTMKEIARQKQNEFGKDYSVELPSEEVVRALSDFMSVIGNDNNLEVNLSQHITIKGNVTNNGQYREFNTPAQLESVSSGGLTSLILITLMTALLNTIRKGEPVHIPWVTDEVGKYDAPNFVALMQMLKDNHVNVVTASPELGITQLAVFAHHYLFEDRGRIRKYSPAFLPSPPAAATTEKDIA